MITEQKETTNEIVTLLNKEILRTGLAYLKNITITEKNKSSEIQQKLIDIMANAIVNYLAPLENAYINHKHYVKNSTSYRYCY